MTSENPLTASSADGSIYDLGYRHYDGVRRGRAYAAWSLYVESLRSIWGFGRPVTAKAAPFIILALYSFLALLQVAFSSAFSQMMARGEKVELFTYSTYFWNFSIFLVLFCIAQAPELVCRDQRNHVLPLYFTRSLHRSDYALTKLSALATALFIVLMIPMIALFVGDVLMRSDAIAAIKDEIPKFLPSIPANLLIAASWSAISLGLSAFSPRRAYSAIGLGAYFLVVEVVAAIVYEVGNRAGWTWSDLTILLAPGKVLMGASWWFFGKTLTVSDGFPASLDAGAYVLAAVASVAIFAATLLWRYRRLAA